MVGVSTVFPVLLEETLLPNPSSHVVQPGGGTIYVLSLINEKSLFLATVINTEKGIGCHLGWWVRTRTFTVSLRTVFCHHYSWILQQCEPINVSVSWSHFELIFCHLHLKESWLTELSYQALNIWLTRRLCPLTGVCRLLVHLSPCDPDNVLVRALWISGSKYMVGKPKD